MLAIVLGLAMSGCSLAADGDWGPLAVVEATGDLARTEGTLLITDRCVLLEGRGETALLIWPADQTRWDGFGQRIVFETTGGANVTLETGQRVGLGGGGSSLAEGGPDHAARFASTEWVNPPDPTCPTDVVWFVTGVE